ncbi:MAG: ribonuclease III [Candidatus Adiutrix sp.]|jgi:ribonuclease-3|nr:ribonuclease III [Candidatus Adiutrix sp.]
MLERLQHRFAEPGLLAAALTHRSAGPARKNGGETDNQRLEYLGDAVLDLVISDVLFRHEPRLAEGEMSRIRAGLVCEARLAEVARSLGLGEALILGPGEAQSGGRDKASVLADAVEALLGAVYLDGGLEAAMAEARRLWQPYLARPDTWADILADYKTRLQEETQKRALGTPDYELIDAQGPAHARLFTMAISLRGERLAAAEAGNKKEAAQAAARAALEIIGKEADPNHDD